MASYKPCSSCGKPIAVTKMSRPDPVCHSCRAILRASKPPKKYSHAPKKHDGTCAECEKPMYLSTRPQGQARCRDCQRARPQRTDPNLRYSLKCAGCEEPFTAPSNKRKYCSSPCFNRADSINKQIRALNDSRVTRNRREAAAPGLGGKARARLNKRWQRQGRTCTYCDQLADTVDHVVPLVRGGSNFEGNLAPCCRRCNSSKSGALLIVWLSTGREISAIQPIPHKKTRSDAEKFRISLKK